MKRAILALTLLAASTAAHAQARVTDANGPLKNYVAKILPRCPAGALTLEPMATTGPANFKPYVATLRSSDQYCGTQKYVLHSPKSGQVVVGTVIPLPNDKRPTNVRVTEEATRLIGKQLTATIAPFPLPDGLKAVAINRPTAWGPFAYNGFVDASEQFLIVGFRGNLNADPTKSLREALNTSAGARRGNAASKVEIIEISDFQCPTCARAHEKIEPLLSKNLSRFNYIRLDLPLFEHHEWALNAALGARALQKVAPAKYWSYVDYVFKNQEIISKRKIDDVVKEWMEDNDVDWNAVSKLYNSKTERQAILDQVSRAFSVGVVATPTFIVNGQIMGFGPDGTFTFDAITNAIGVPPVKPAAKPAAKPSK
ncbi:MAG TPA: thioredoxin domain-containing protein [Thermoanaerobaculia bacterium]|nr:thioredoxin domain-containing protein [Thermoanaerobaculia bacterium]